MDGPARKGRAFPLIYIDTNISVRYVAQEVSYVRFV